MAVEIPVIIDIMGGIDDAIVQVPKVMKKLQSALDDNPIEANITLGNVEQANSDLKKLNQWYRELENADWEKIGSKLDLSPFINQAIMELKSLESQINELQELRQMEGGQGDFSFAEEYKALNAQVESVARSIQGLQAAQAQLDQTFGNSGFMRYVESLTETNEELRKMREYYSEMESYADKYASSINAIRDRIAELTAQWNAMTKAERNSAEGQAHYNKYKAEVKELREEALTLSQLLQKEEQRNRMIQQTAQKRRIENAILNTTKESLTILQEKERILSERLSNAAVGTSKYEKLKKQLQDVRIELERVNKDISGGGAEADVVLTKADSKMANLVKNSLRLVALHSASTFIRNVREVTAEFEMQRVALAGIIQDTAQAESLFKQLKAAAIKSPFEIKQLVTFTKQLSAYRIETDKLYDVTMQLADVSAGLGVDMNRLVLAYGQVRAASVLRGQELRQFTEAGIPLVDLLAKKFTELNGRATSTAEVFELISKRAVSFSMIEEIFNDMTAAGGTFYKMQEKQAETLKGQWMKLKDALSIMYDEIGNTNAAHKGMEKLIASAMRLMQNWRLVSGALTAVAAAFSAIKIYSMFLPNLVKNTELAKKATDAYKRSATAARLADQTGSKSFANTAKRLRSVADSLNKASKASTAFGRGWHQLAAYMKGGGWVGIVITAVSALVGWIVKARMEAQRLGKELAQNVSKGNLQIEQAERNFQRLADAAVKAADGSSEQREALKELERTYGDMVPSQDLQIEKLRALKGNYEAVTAAIEEKIQAQIHEQNINQIQETYGTKLGSTQKRLENFLKDSGYTTEEANRIIAGVNRAIKDGLLTTETLFFDAAKTINQIVEEEIGEAPPDYFGQYFQNYTSPFHFKSDYKILLQETKEFNDATKEEDARFQGLNNTLGKYADRLKQIREEVEKAPEGFTSKQAGTFEFNQARWKQAVSIYKRELTEAFGDSIADAFKTEDAIDFNVILDQLSLLDEQASGKLKGFVEALQKEYLKIAPQDATTRLVTEAAQRFAEEVGIEMSKVQGYLKKDETSMTDYAKSVEEAVKTQKDHIAELEFLRSNYRAGSNYAKPSPEEIAAQKDELAFLEKLQNLVKDFLTTSKSSSKKSSLSFLKEELKNVQEIYKRYKEFVEYLGEAGAQEEIKKIYGDVTAIDFLDPEKYKNRLADILRQIRELQGTVRQYNREMSQDMFNDIKASIKKNEGLRLEAYKNPGEAYYTIGYGFYKSLPDGRQITEGMKLTTEEAEELLDQYIKTYSSTVDKLLADYGQGLQLTEKQFNVLVDLAFQGPAALKKALIKAQGDTEALAEALKDAAWPLVSQQLQGAVKERDMRRYAAFVAGGASEEEAEEVFQAIFDAERIVQDVDWDELKDELDESLKKLAEDIKRSETARNFYDEILGLTGDEKLATDLTVSIYGSIGKDFQERIQSQLLGALSSLKAEDIDKDLLSQIKGDIALFDIDAIKANLDKLPPKVRDVFQKALEENEKYNADWLINFEKTYAKAKTYGERVNQLLAQQRQKEQEARAAGKSEAEVKAVTEYFNRQIAAVQLEAMKDTYTWTKAFENLEGVSSKTLKNLIKLIDDYIDKYAKDLDPQQLKELIRAREQAEAQETQRNAFKAMAQAISNLVTKRRTLNALEKKGIKTEELEAASEDKIKKNIKDLSDAYNEAIAEINEYISATKELLSVFATADDAAYFGEQMDNLSKTMAGIGKAGIGIAQLASGIITPQSISQTVTGLAEVVGGIFSLEQAAQTKRVTKEIERQQKKVEDLEESYENLSRAIEKAFGNDYIYNYSQQMENLIAQQEAYQKQVDTLNEASDTAKTKKKKKEFQDQAEEASKQVREIATAISELKDTASEFWAGEDLASAAESFADAWLDAYQEFGDTAGAIEERMTEMVQNIVKKAALSEVVQNIMGDWYKSLAEVEEWNSQTIAQKLKEAMALVDPINEGLMTWAGALQAEGQSLRGGVGQFTGIKRDIAGASEESINGLAAGINTQNFYMSYISQNVAAILTYLTGGSVVAASTATGVATDPYKDAVLLNISSLPQMRDDLFEIRTLLSRVVRAQSNGQYYVQTNL